MTRAAFALSCARSVARSSARAKTVYAAALLAPALAAAQTGVAPAPDAAAAAPAQVASAPAHGLAPQLGLVLDVGYGSRAIALPERDKGLHLGGAELSLSTPLGPWLQGQLTAAAHSHDEKIETHIEEAWLGTTALPAGWQLRGGRFLSQVGYLNEQHPHADDFSHRPLLYRAFLGGHYFDDGLRLNWTAPTSFYWRTGLEVFRGKALTENVSHKPRPGVWTLSTKLGGDLGTQHSWQLGLSYLANRRAAHAVAEDEGDHADGHDHSHHGHAHGAAMAGQHLWLIDGVWKWAPDGNNRNRQLRLAFELARQTRLGPGASRHARNTAGYLAAVYRFHPSWEAGVRTDWLQGHLPHGDHFHAARLREHSLMLAYKPSHQQSLRVQYTHQGGARGFDKGNAVYVQYVISFGAHGAHGF
ncbi:MAG: hypothetical protein Q4F13_12770 [Pseudomonadota bacterium]|nr:hypothetical protein [Pseudomonadota bacterium]